MKPTCTLKNLILQKYYYHLITYSYLMYNFYSWVEGTFEEEFTGGTCVLNQITVPTTN